MDVKGNQGVFSLNIGAVFGWTVAFLLLMLLIVGIDMGIWRRVAPNTGTWLNLATMVVLYFLFFRMLVQRTEFRIRLWTGVSVGGILAALGCGLFFYFALDRFLDPFFEGLFPVSQEEYLQTVRTLRQSPVSTFVLVCIIAPVAEEILMRGFVLGGLRTRYGTVVALAVSSVLFAFLHFNMVQSLSALVCGIVLGMLYIRTGSIFCCMLAHVSYNAISYFTVILSAAA